MAEAVQKLSLKLTVENLEELLSNKETKKTEELVQGW
jgi:hypothetical protein